ncbi:DUF6348 family protein [Spirillospora sp. NPDC029432]|uniref:DUF6348 family protein n=1 Tax=Spirillospora sp. NPDC029432 TaxID=3154599 RepID=UPI0034567331
MEISAQEVAAFLGRLLSEGHGLAARVEGAMVHLPDQKMRVAVDTPEIQHRGMSIRVPIGVNHPSWGEPFAWDQAVGIAADERHPVAQALDAWTHNVLPVFAAMAMPADRLPWDGHGSLKSWALVVPRG